MLDNASAFRLASKLIFSFVEMVLTAPFLPGLVCHALDRGPARGFLAPRVLAMLVRRVRRRSSACPARADQYPFFVPQLCQTDPTVQGLIRVGCRRALLGMCQVLRCKQKGAHSAGT